MDPLEEPSIYPRSSAYILDPGEYKPLTTGNVKIEMTKGVTTKHVLEKKDKYGEIELQEMCFYLENKFQVIILRMFMMSILIMRIRAYIWRTIPGDYLAILRKFIMSIL